jgi:hypothetical protein
MAALSTGLVTSLGGVVERYYRIWRTGFMAGAVGLGVGCRWISCCWNERVC